MTTTSVRYGITLISLGLTAGRLHRATIRCAATHLSAHPDDQRHGHTTDRA